MSVACGHCMLFLLMSEVFCHTCSAVADAVHSSHSTGHVSPCNAVGQCGCNNLKLWWWLAIGFQWGSQWWAMVVLRLSAKKKTICKEHDWSQWVNHFPRSDFWLSLQSRQCLADWHVADARVSLWHQVQCPSQHSKGKSTFQWHQQQVSRCSHNQWLSFAWLVTKPKQSWLTSSLLSAFRAATLQSWLHENKPTRQKVAFCVGQANFFFCSLACATTAKRLLSLASLAWKSCPSAFS